MSIASIAEAHVRSYAAIFTKNSSISTLANEMTSHYYYPFTSFVLGRSFTIPTQEQMARDSTPYLEKWKTQGLLRFTLAKSRVEEISPTSAFCWMTFELEEKDGQGGWTWENVYVYRQSDQRTGFEASYADNEFLALMQHKPEMLQGMM